MLQCLHRQLYNIYHFKNYTEVTAFSGFIEQMGNVIQLSSISVHRHPSAGYYPASMQMDAYELMYID